MNIKPLKTEQDYQQALLRLEVIFDALPDTPEGDELEVLGRLISNYENVNSPIDRPDLIETMKFRMEQMNYSNQ